MELAYAAAYSLGNISENNSIVGEAQLPTSFNPIREDENKADMESGSILPSFPPDASSSLSRSKGLCLTSHLCASLLALKII